MSFHDFPDVSDEMDIEESNFDDGIQRDLLEEDLDLNGALSDIADHSDNEQPEGQSNDNQVPPEPDDPTKAKGKAAEKKRVVQKQPKLDAVRLMGPKGIIAVKHSFADFDFRKCGKMKEDEALDLILKRYEHWAHRLFPKLAFNDVIPQITKVGHKHAVKNYMYRLRTDQLRPEDDLTEQINDDDPEDVNPTTGDDHMNSPNTADAFDDLVGDAYLMAEMDGDVPQVAQTTEVLSNIDMENNVLQPSTIVPLSDEQLERMRVNRELALEKRNARLRVLQEQEATDNS